MRDGHGFQPAPQHRMSGNLRSLILRAWLEPDAGPPLRIRVVELEPGHAERSVLVTASAEEACSAVRRWLQKVQAGPEAGPPRVTPP